VAGFRFDAAKHMPPADIAAIQKLLIRPAYLVQEVPGSTAQALEYTPNGDVWAWDMMEKVTSMYGIPGQAATAVTYDMLDTPSYPPSDKSLSWVTNHDTEHHGGAVTYQQGKLYQLAFTWLLAEKYGKPMLYSGYAFSIDDDQAPFLANGFIADAKCASSTGPVVKVVTKKNKKTKKVTKTTYPTVGIYKDGQFTCVQRWTSVRGMIAFHKYVGQADKSNVFAKKGVYGFGRSGKGFVLINSNTATYKASKVATGMAAGNYCELTTGGTNPVRADGACMGAKVTIAADGTVTANVPAISAIAITEATKLP
jgi:alpha-amylase